MKDSLMSAWRKKELAIRGKDYGFGAFGRVWRVWTKEDLFEGSDGWITVGRRQMQVVVEALCSPAGQRHNGHTAWVTAGLDPASGRCTVVLDASREQIKVKPANIRVVRPHEVAVEEYEEALSVLARSAVYNTGNYLQRLSTDQALSSQLQDNIARVRACECGIATASTSFRIGAFVLFSGLDKTEVDDRVIYEGFVTTAHPEKFTGYPNTFPNGWGTYRGQIIEASFRSDASYQEVALAAQRQLFTERYVTAVYLKIQASCGQVHCAHKCNCKVCAAAPFWLPGENVVLETGGYEARLAAVRRSTPTWPVMKHRQIERVEVEKKTEIAELTTRFEEVPLFVVQQQAGTFPWRMKHEEWQGLTRKKLIAEMVQKQVEGRVVGKAPEHMLDTQPATKLTKAAQKAKDDQEEATKVAKAKKTEAEELREATKAKKKEAKEDKDKQAKELREATKARKKEAKEAKEAKVKQAKELRDAKAIWRQGFLDFLASADRDMEQEEVQRSKLDELVVRHGMVSEGEGENKTMRHPDPEPAGSLRYLCYKFNVPLQCLGTEKNGAGTYIKLKNKPYLIDALIYASWKRNADEYDGSHATPHADDSACIRSAYVASLKKVKKDAVIGENAKVPTGFAISYALRECCEKNPGGPRFSDLVRGDGLGVSVTLRTIANSGSAEVSKYIGKYTPIGIEEKQDAAGACYVRAHGLGRMERETYVFYDARTQSWFLSNEAFGTKQPAAIAVMCEAGLRWAHLPLPRCQKWAQFTSNPAGTVALEGVELRFDAWNGDDDDSDVHISTAHHTVCKDTAETANVGSGQPTTKVATDLEKRERELSNELAAGRTEYYAKDPGVSAAADARMQVEAGWPGPEGAKQLYAREVARGNPNLMPPTPECKRR